LKVWQGVFKKSCKKYSGADHFWAVSNREWTRMNANTRRSDAGGAGNGAAACLNDSRSFAVQSPAIGCPSTMQLNLAPESVSTVASSWRGPSKKLSP
jgi:hypothetical protein